jgi:hypothetical protein
VYGGGLAKYHNFICAEISRGGYRHRLLKAEHWKGVKTVYVIARDMNDIFPILLQELPTLQKIHMANVVLSGIESISHFTNLSAISIFNMTLDLVTIGQIGRAVAQNHNIHTLELFRCSAPLHESIADRLLEELGDKHNLRRFYIKSCGAIRSSNHLSNVLKSGTLEEITICNMYCTMNVNTEIVDAIIQCKGIKKLSLTGCFFDWADRSRQFRDILQHQPQLRYLDISHSYNLGGLDKLDIHQDHVLEELNLSYCCLYCHNSADAIIQILQRCSNLKRLDLSSNFLEADGAEVIAPYVATHASLESLLIAQNDLGQRGLAAISNAAKANPRLRFLDIRKNKTDGKEKVDRKVVAAAAVIIRDLVAAIGHRCRIIS